RKAHMTDNQEDARKLIDRYWEDLLKLEPILGTEVGDERYDGRLPDPSEAGLAHREAVQRAAIADLAAIDRSSLDVSTRTTLDVLEAIALRDLDAIEYRFDRFSAPLHIWGPAGLIAELASRQRVDTPERRERYLRRLEALSAYLDQMGKVAGGGMRAGQTGPEV